MDYTNREMVSKVTNVLKTNNRDERISRRFILSLLKSTASVLISQKWLDRTIFLENNLYTELNCFEFEKEDVVKCHLIEFRRCDVLMKSKKPLPKPVFSRLGASIKEISSVDGNFRFTYLDKGQYQRNKKRQHSLKDEVYVYLDSQNYLYIPDHEIYSVDLTLLTMYPEEAENSSSCTEKGCTSKWDEKFVCPDKLLDVTLAQTLQVLGITRNTREDQNPNNAQGV